MSSLEPLPSQIARPAQLPEHALHPTQKLDLWGLLFSGICLIHCLALPLILAGGPILAGSALGDHRFHQWLLLAILPTSAVALTLGCRRHGGYSVLVMGLVGLGVLIFAAIAHETAQLSMNQTRTFTILGGLLVAAGHVLNFRRCRSLRHQHCAHS